MAIDKALNRAPLGMQDDTDVMTQGPDIEIEIEDPEAVRIGVDGEPILEIEKDEDEDEFNQNLAEVLDEGELTELASELLSDFEADISARKDWMQTYVDGLDQLGMKIEERTEPWPGACGVVHPLLAEALVKFQSETIMETFPAMGPVKTQIIGKETQQKKEAAARVRDDMNYQLTDRMVEYRPEHERMLWGLGLAGNAFKKVYYDPSLERQTAIFVPAEDMVVPYGASSLETAERVTHVMRKTKNELRKLMVAGFYKDIDLPDPVAAFDEVEKKIAEKMGFQATEDDRYKILEMHVNIDLPGYEDEDEDGEKTGIALPYVVTIEKNTQTILSIRRNWEPDDELKSKRQHFVHYGYIPGFGFYHFGLIHLIGSFAKSGTSLIRQLVDAGTLSNLPGGFKTRGLRVKGDDTPISPAEFRDVDVPSGTIKDNIMTLPYKEPSQVLAALLEKIIDDGRRFAAIADLKVSDMSAQSPVGTTLAILERMLKVMSAVQARIHYSMKQEFRLLKAIIRDYTPESYSYEPEEGPPSVKQSDYDQVDVIPVSDPNAATMSQKVVQYQAVLQLAQGAPDIYDMPKLHRQMLEVLGIKNAEKLVPMPEDQKPRDPISENMAIINCKPVKAFLYQDHEAHIQVHMSTLQDPKIAQIMGQSPMVNQITNAMAAHIQEHIAFAYRKQMEDMIGAELPKPDTDIPEEYELAISRLAAKSSQKLLQKNQTEAQQQQAQAEAQNPLTQIQMQELQIKQAEVERKKQKDIMDAAAKADQLEIEKMRIQTQAQIEGAKLGSKMVQDKEEKATRDQIEGIRLGLEMGRAAKEAKESKESKPPKKESK